MCRGYQRATGRTKESVETFHRSFHLCETLPVHFAEVNNRRKIDFKSFEQSAVQLLSLSRRFLPPLKLPQQFEVCIYLLSFSFFSLSLSLSPPLISKYILNINK